MGEEGRKQGKGRGAGSSGITSVAPFYSKNKHWRPCKYSASAASPSAARL